MGVREHHCKAFFAVWALAFAVSLGSHALWVYGLGFLHLVQETPQPTLANRAVLVRFIPRQEKLHDSRLKRSEVGQTDGQKTATEGIATSKSSIRSGSSDRAQERPRDLKDQVSPSHTGSSFGNSVGGIGIEPPLARSALGESLLESVQHCAQAPMRVRTDEFMDLRDFGLLPRSYKVRFKMDRSSPVLETFSVMNASELAYADSLLRATFEDCLVKRWSSLDFESSAPHLNFESIVTFIWKGSASDIDRYTFR